MRFLVFLEDLQFSHWVKEAQTVWAFPMILFVHTLGMSIVAGGSAMLSLILLGFWPALPIKPFARVFPVLWVAFGINAVSGTMMLVADATTKLTTSGFLHQDGVCVRRIIRPHTNAPANIRGSATRSGPAVRQRKNAGLGLAGLLVWRNHLRPPAGLRQVAGRRNPGGVVLFS